MPVPFQYFLFAQHHAVSHSQISRTSEDLQMILQWFCGEAMQIALHLECTALGQHVML